MNDEIESLNDYQHARLRTEMYMGSRDPHTQVVIDYVNGSPVAKEETWVPVIFTAMREIWDNSIDEVVTHGHGDQIEVRYDEVTCTVSISDNGRGIPISKDEKTGKFKATMALSETKAGRNFRDRGATRGMNGVGASIVNLCSEYFQVDIFRDGKHFSQRFTEGEDNIQIPKPSIRASKKPTGTHIEFKLSPKVFHDRTLPESFVRARVFELALCYPNLKITYQGKKVSARGGPDKTIFSNNKPITFEVSTQGFKTKFWLVPSFFTNGAEYSYGLVNGIPLFNGGVHIDAFRRQFYSNMLQALAPISKRKKLLPNKSDLADGMLLYSITEMDGPNFDSQSKTRLINEPVKKIVTEAISDPEFFKGVIAKNKAWVDLIYARCEARTRKKESADIDKAAKENKKLRIAKLEDAVGRDRQKCILFLAEGDSAIGGMTDARDPEIHGGLPLRGKVLNVHPTQATLKKVMENEELSQIMATIGLVPGRRVNRLNLRYGKVYITADADEDGKNITALLVNFFYQLWPELFDPKSPFIYVFDTPLIIAGKGKQKKYWYNENYDTFNGDDYKGWDITRAKGLAGLKEEDWNYVLSHPKVRPIFDDGKLAEALDLLFNKKRADDRRAWIGM